MNKGLVQLFESLSKSEKRYTRVSMDDKKHKNLIDIYNALNDQTQINASNSAQYRLLDMILDHLVSYHRSENTDQKLLLELNKAKVLYNKGMTSLARKHLNKLKRTATSEERFLVLLKILEFEIICYKDEGVILDQAREKLKELYNQEQEVLAHQQWLSTVRYHTIDYLLITRNRVGPLSQKISDEFRIVIHKLESAATGSSGTESKVYLHNLKGMYHFNESDFKKSREYFGRAITALEDSESGVRTYAKEYFFALNNLLITSVLIEDFNAFRKHLKKIRNVFGNDKRFKKDLFATTLMYEIGLNTELGYYSRVTDMEETIVTGIKKYSVNLVNRQIFYINLAISFLAQNKLNKANRYIMELITDTPSKRINSNSNIYFYSNLLSLTIQLDKEEYDLLEYSVQSVSNQISRIRPLNRFDQRIVNYIKASGEDPANRKKLSKDLLKDKVFTDSEESRFAHQIFDYTTWLRSFVEGSSMQIIKNRERSIDLYG